MNEAPVATKLIIEEMERLGFEWHISKDSGTYICEFWVLGANGEVDDYPTQGVTWQSAVRASATAALNTYAPLR
jgi:pyrrolidone-carboxylate peptidase